MASLIDKTIEKFRTTKIVLSLARQRMDRDEWNVKSLLIHVHAVLKQNFRKSENISIGINSNLAEQPVERL